MSYSRVVALIALLAIACGKNDEKAAQQAAAAAREAEQTAASAKQAQEAAEKATRERTAVKEAMKKDVDAVDRKLTYLRERAGKLTGAAKTAAQKAMHDTDAKREAVQNDLKKLDPAAAADWDTVRASFDRDVAALKASMDAFERSVTGKPAH